MYAYLSALPTLPHCLHRDYYSKETNHCISFGRLQAKGKFSESTNQAQRFSQNSAINIVWPTQAQRRFRFNDAQFIRLSFQQGIAEVSRCVCVFLKIVI